MARLLCVILLVFVLVVTSVQAFSSRKNEKVKNSRLNMATRIQIDSLPYIHPSYRSRQDEYKEPNHDTPLMEKNDNPLMNGWITYDETEYPHSSTTTTQASPLQYNQQHNDDATKERVVAAGVGSGVLGMMVGGPVGAMVLGFSAAFAAETKGGVVGDSARAVGDVALSASMKAKEIDEKHHVVDSSIKAASNAWEAAKELDRQHKIVKKAKDVAIYSSTATVDFVLEHKLVEKSAKGIVKGIGWLSEVIAAESLSGANDNLNDKAFKSLPARPSTPSRSHRRTSH